MNKNIYKARAGFICCFLVLTMYSCGENNKSNNQPPEPGQEDLLKLNRELVKEEQQQIADYKIRYGYNMLVTKTGLHVMHIDSGRGEKPVMLDGVEIKYKINFLDGKYVYSSDSSGTLQFRLGQSSEPAGLQEGLLHLREGGKALIIVPSYLAYGLTGDENKIGSARTLVYTVELVKVIK